MTCRVALVLALVTAAAVAQPSDTPSASASHRAAARELYDVVAGQHMVEAAVDAMMPMIQSNPALAPYEDIFRDWALKVIGGPDVVDEMVRLYTEAFSEAELRELLVFYQSPVGRKALSQIPVIMQKGKAVGEAKAKEHLPELLEKIKEREKERKVDTKPST